MAQPPAHERVRHRLREWIEDRGHGSQRALARAVPSGKFTREGAPVPRSDQWMSDILAGRTQLGLDDLDAVSAHMGVAPGWLVRGHDRNYEECTMAESRLLSYYRRLPELIQRQWIGWLDFLFERISLVTNSRNSVKIRTSGAEQETAYGGDGSVADVSRPEDHTRILAELGPLAHNLSGIVSRLESTTASAPERAAGAPARSGPRDRNPHAKAAGGFRRKSFHR